METDGAVAFPKTEGWNPTVEIPTDQISVRRWSESPKRSRWTSNLSSNDK